jgi:hypothetical protein
MSELIELVQLIEDEGDKVKFVSPNGAIEQIPIVEPDPIQPTKKKLNAMVSFLLAIILIAFYVILESQILNLPFTFRQKLLGPYLQVLHEWVLFVKHIYTFLKRAYPNNALTTTLEKLIIYVVDAIPNETLKTYVKTAPQTVALRPHIKNALTEILRNLQTPENTRLITELISLSKSTEELFEIGRILGIDEATLSKLPSQDAKYIDMLHIVNNYQTRFNQLMDYFIKLFNTTLLTATTLDLTQEDAIFQSVSQILRSATDFQAGNIVSKLLSDTIPNLIKDVDQVLQGKFAEEGLTMEARVEELDGGKRKTKRKTLRKRKTLKKRKTPSKKFKKQRNTRIIHQKLNRLTKFILMQKPNRN